MAIVKSIIAKVLTAFYQPFCSNLFRFLYVCLEEFLLNKSYDASLVGLVQRGFSIPKSVWSGILLSNDFV